MSDFRLVFEIIALSLRVYLFLCFWPTLYPNVSQIYILLSDSFPQFHLSGGKHF